MVEMRVMVLGAGGPAADNYIKSLRLADPSIYTLGVDTHPLMLELSCASETVVLDTRPGRGEEGVDHARELMILKHDYGITMIHAQPDEEVRFLSHYAETFEPEVSVPHGDVVKACQDKLRCADLLGDLAPESWSLVGYDWTSTEEVRWMRARVGAGSLAANRVTGPKGATEWWSVWADRICSDDFMLSEYLPGEDRSYTGVWWRGEPVASACRVRVEYADTRTPSGQCSSPRIAKLDSRPETFDTAEAAIRRVSEATNTVPHGVFYVDMRESADGRLLVTEINAGRFNTTQNFYAEAGANLPYLHASLHHHGNGSWDVPQGIHGDPDRMRGDVRLWCGDDYYWLRQPDMGHKLVTKARVTA